MLEPSFQNHYSSNKFCCENKAFGVSCADVPSMLTTSCCRYVKHARLTGPVGLSRTHCGIKLSQKQRKTATVQKAGGSPGQGLCSVTSLSLNFQPDSTSSRWRRGTAFISRLARPGFPGWLSPAPRVKRGRKPCLPTILIPQSIASIARRGQWMTHMGDNLRTKAWRPPEGAPGPQVWNCFLPEEFLPEDIHKVR